MDSREMRKWLVKGPVGAQSFVRVEHCETGQVGYRRLSWNHGLHSVFGPVYGGPNCLSEAMAKELGIPLDQADLILCA